MDQLTKKINHLKWLQAIGVDYYFLEDNKEQKNLIDIKPKIQDNLNYEKVPILPDIINSTKGSTSINTLKKTNVKLALQPNSSPAIDKARALADSATNLEDLKKLLMDFDGCGLKKLATNTVFADGNPGSSIMLIGEAPGSNEDAQGIPFCGESGKLLDNVLSAINISRKHNAYITNTVFWRPPANRQPTNDEIDICRPFVEKHIALINPKLIILVGSVAATSLLGKNAGVTKIRQEYYLYDNKYLKEPIHTTAIFHPAYLLRQPMQKKTTWYDLLKIQEFINVNIISKNT